jgi:pimeloyl-ACP methyl ester carboxylesterase
LSSRSWKICRGFLSSPKRTIVSINLFFHGASIFPEDRIEKDPLRLEEFLYLFQKILEKENVNQFHLLAFSQGGRFSLCLIPHYTAKLLSATLISPDGMDNNSFYNWSSRQKWARLLFVNFEKKPSKLIRLSSLATKTKLMRPKVKVFVNHFASNENTFKRASATWRTFRIILPDNKAISDSLIEKKIPFKIIMGSYDQVIRPKQAYKFAEKIGLPNCVVEIPNGHDFFKESSINKFIHLLPFVEQ